mgnify:CR=1 FL=1
MPLFPGFSEVDIETEGARIHARVGGSGEPLLLLHGYPQTHAMWHPIAAELAQSYTVVAADLRGYGESVAHEKDFTFRTMAKDQVRLMEQLGHKQFHVVSHDRGARTAHRMALDHPASVRSIALFDILPTLEVWRLMDAWLARKYYHWTFLAHPSDMPQRLINSEPLTYLRATLAGLGGLNIFAPEAMAEYERAAQKPSVVEAWCGDYLAGATTDLDHDRADVGSISDIPCLVLWGDKGVVGKQVDPLETWRQWFANVSGHALDTGHFLVEEKPEEVLEAVRQHLAAATAA